MCDPLTAAIVSGVIGVVQTGASVIAAGKTAAAQEKAIREQNARVSEENRVKASTEMFDQTRAARREQAAIRVAAGEAGLSLNSGSVEALLLDSAAQLEMANSRSIANLESRQSAITAETESMLSQVQKPTLLGAGLQIAGAAASGWSAVQDAKLSKAQASNASKPTN